MGNVHALLQNQWNQTNLWGYFLAQFTPQRPGIGPQGCNCWVFRAYREKSPRGCLILSPAVHSVR